MAHGFQRKMGNSEQECTDGITLFPSVGEHKKHIADEIKILVLKVKRRFPSTMLQVLARLDKKMLCGLVINVLFNYNLLSWRKPPIPLLCKWAIWNIEHLTMRCPDHEKNSPFMELKVQGTAVGFFPFSFPTWQPIQCSFLWSKQIVLLYQADKGTKWNTTQYWSINGDTSAACLGISTRQTLNNARDASLQAGESENAAFQSKYWAILNSTLYLIYSLSWFWGALVGIQTMCSSVSCKKLFHNNVYDFPNRA